MHPLNFAYWLQGFFEITDPKSLDATQTQIIKDHLDLVFRKETPDRRPEPPVAPKEPSLPIPARIPEWKPPHEVPIVPLPYIPSTPGFPIPYRDPFSGPDIIC